MKSDTLPELKAFFEPQLRVAVKGNLMEYVGSDGVWTQILSTRSIPLQFDYSFHCRVVNTFNKSIIVGIIDKYKINEPLKSGNALCYWGWNGELMHADDQSSYQ